MAAGRRKMTTHKTVTLVQINWLNSAIGMAEDWRGNQDPKSYDEFDEWVVSMREALKAVRADRKLLRSYISADKENKDED